MTSVTYPAKFKYIPGEGYLVNFIDIPEARTFGHTIDHARHNAKDCLDTALHQRIKDREEFPTRSIIDPNWDDVYDVTIDFGD